MALNSSTSNSESPSGKARGWKLAVVLVLVLAAGDWIFRIDAEQGDGVPERRAFEQQVFELDPELVYGVAPRHRVVSTSQGLRGDTFGSGAFNVLLMGASTAYCQLLDEDAMLVARIAQAIPALARNRVDARFATSARGGQPLEKSISNLERILVDEDTKPRLVLTLFGALSTAAFYMTAPWPVGSGPAGAHASPAGPYSGRNQRALFKNWYRPGDHGEFLVRARRAYRDHPKLGELLPPLRAEYESDLALFEERLASLHTLTLASRAKLVLMTQPLNFAGSDRDVRTARYAPFYLRSGGGFVPSPSLLFELVSGFNDRTRRYASAHGLPMIDLAREFDRCADCYYDQWHFNVEGARRAGQYIASELMRAGIFERGLD